MSRMALLALAVAALAGCEREPAAPAPTPTPTATAPPATDTVSIIRPDVDVEREAAKPLAPLKLRIGFEEGGATLSVAAIEVLAQALASEQAKAGGAITLGGHSDSVGEDGANLVASRKRAEAVRDWLMANGVAEDRIILVAFGEQNPVAPNALANGEPDPAGRARNRRVELTIAVPEGTSPAVDPGESDTLVDELTDDQ